MIITNVKISVGELKSLIAEANKIAPSASYMKKEALRKLIQDAVTSSVATGDIKDEDGLKSFFADVDTAATALKSIPFEVWSKLASR